MLHLKVVWHLRTRINRVVEVYQTEERVKRFLCHVDGASRDD
jgi:hypothetical protein